MYSCVCFIFNELALLSIFNCKYWIPNDRGILRCLTDEEVWTGHCISRWNAHLVLLLWIWQGMVLLTFQYCIVSRGEEPGVGVWWDDTRAKCVTKHSQHQRAWVSIWLFIAALANFHIGGNLYWLWGNRENFLYSKNTSTGSLYNFEWKDVGGWLCVVPWMNCPWTFTGRTEEDGDNHQDSREPQKQEVLATTQQYE